MVSSLQQRKTGDAASTSLLFADHQPVRMETPAGVQVEVEHFWGGVERWTKKGEGRRSRYEGRAKVTLYRSYSRSIGGNRG